MHTNLINVLIQDAFTRGDSHESHPSVTTITIHVLMFMQKVTLDMQVKGKSAGILKPMKYSQAEITQIQWKSHKYSGNHMLNSHPL